MWLKYLRFLLRGGLTLDLTITPLSWYIIPYCYDNHKVGAGLKWLCLAAHSRFVYYKTWKKEEDKANAMGYP